MSFCETKSLVKIDFVRSVKNKVNSNINKRIGYMKKSKELFQKDLSFLCTFKELKVKDKYA